MEEKPDHAQSGSHGVDNHSNSGMDNLGMSPSLSTNSNVDNVRITLFTNLIYQSSYLLAPSRVLSAILIGSAGTGKTLNLSKFRAERHVYYTNMISPKFLIEFLKRVERGEKTIIVIPDFLTATEGSKNNRENVIKILRAMTEEGIDDVSYYGYPEVHFKFPVRAGLITAITYSGMSEFKKVWKDNGFLSRLIPFSYSISEGLRNDIEKQIKGVESLKEEERLPSMKKNMINHKTGKVVLPEDMAYRLDVTAYKLADVTGNKSAPFRQEKQIYTLAKAHASLRHSHVVEQIDVDTVIELSNWINLEFNKI